MNLNRLEQFVVEMSEIVGREKDEPGILKEGGLALGRLIATDDWLPDAYAQPSPEHYQQFLLYADPGERFSVVSFVWGPGQRTPVHDHTVWGLIGMLRGAECSVSFEPSSDGYLVPGKEVVLHEGDVEAVSPTVGDIHRVNNIYDDRVSISIHVYGADIGKVERSVYPLDLSGRPSRTAKRFISGYSNASAPDLRVNTAPSHS